MSERNNIRHEHWQTVIDAASARGIRLSAEDLLRVESDR